jgi:hypothetical protein
MSRIRRRTATLAVVLLAAACTDGDAEKTATPRTSLTTTPTTEAAPAADSVALETDQPCTRQAVDVLTSEAGAVRLEDLERMVLPQEDLGTAVRGFELDIMRSGYLDNAEVQYVEINPPTTCDDLARFGRITGYSAAFTSYDEQIHSVSTAVHLFHDTAGATGWMQAFADGLRALVGTTDGPIRVDITPLDDLGPDARLIEHEGAEGVRTWAMFARGPVVGWIVDLHPRGRPTVDVSSFALAVAERIDHVMETVDDRSESRLAAARVAAAPLPRQMLGDRYGDLPWDWFFGGCTDNRERASYSPDPVKAARDLELHRRVSGCTAMYSRSELETQSADIVRIFSAVSVFEDAEGASADLASFAADTEARANTNGPEGSYGAVERFPVVSIGEEAIGLRSALTSEPAFTDTRVVFRRGPIVGTVALHDRSDHDGRDELTRLAAALDLRIQALLATD